MKVLVSSTRQTYGLGAVRKLGRCGHVVVAMDSLASAPGSHSRYASRRVRCPSPRFETRAFLETLARVLREERIELDLPMFEEVFYVGAHLDELSELASIFCPPLETLTLLHHKGRCLELAASLGVRTPRARVATSRAELEGAMDELGRYVARPVFSRGGTSVLTNAGALAGAGVVERPEPSAARPWVVQEYVEGEDVCSYAVATHGRLAAQCSYVHPLEVEHGTGIVSITVDEPEAVEIARRVVEATDYHGQIGLDFRRASDGRLILLECNPRATPGLHLMDDELFVRAVTEPAPPEPAVVPAGVRRKLSLAIVRQITRERRLAWRGIASLLSRRTKDVMTPIDDPMPGLWQVLTFPQLIAYRRYAGRDRDRRADIVNAYAYDVEWDGQPIP